MRAARMLFVLQAGRTVATSPMIEKISFGSKKSVIFTISPSSPAWRYNVNKYRPTSEYGLRVTAFHCRAIRCTLFLMLWRMRSVCFAAFALRIVCSSLKVESLCSSLAKWELLLSFSMKKKIFCIFPFNPFSSSFNLSVILPTERDGTTPIYGSSFCSKSLMKRKRNSAVSRYCTSFYIFVRFLWLALSRFWEQVLQSAAPTVEDLKHAGWTHPWMRTNFFAAFSISQTCRTRNSFLLLP